ncbi:enoyl-CoA hydratase [Terriglobus albidus]|uniref:Enoyl-CoA hydratase n=1 Tax=Terriglobus albidus TaxID=1592106 RepID=A0A5B9E7J8_9BACT|nr:enoyl-CoA hydratase-related protein [Terriglobus albidus]QEE27534.1 enoyl-CoA hydratase [Terriglobus albidus]
MNTLLTDLEEGILTITLNRPERRNALTPEMQEELIAAFEAAKTGAVKVVILTGAGAAFCSGLDLAVLESMFEQTVEEQKADAQRTAQLFRTLYALPIPAIAAVNGHAIAGGTGLATLCDFTFAVPGAKFGYTEVKIGFIPALVSVFLGLQLGDKQARNLLLTGQLFDAQQAHELGLVNEIVASEMLLERVHLFAQELLQNSPSAMRKTKELLIAQTASELDARIERAVAASLHTRQHPDFQEGVTAFLSKRKPRWQD